MRAAFSALLILALATAGCAAPREDGRPEGAEAAFIVASDNSPRPAPPPAPHTPSAAETGRCAHDPCSARVAEGFYAEPAVAFAPGEPNKILVASFGTDGSSTGSWAYFAMTSDGGATWSSVRAPAAPTLVPEVLPTGQLTIVADTVAAWPDPETLVVIALLGETLHTPDWEYVRAISVVQWRSEDGGATWSEAVVVARAEGLTGSLAGTTIHGGWFDKPALAHDTATGTLHLFFHRILRTPTAFSIDLLRMRSDDAGATWSAPTPIAEMANLYGVTAVAHDGLVLATVVNPGYRIFRSEDEGGSWEEVAELSTQRPGTGTWQSAPLGLWVDAAGGMHALAARADGRENERLLLHVSHDGGRTWSNGTIMMPEVATERRNPVLTVDPVTGSGVLASHQGNGSGEALETWAIPLDEGVPRAPIRLDEVASTRGVFEYFGGAASGSTAAVAFPSADDTGSPLYVGILQV